MAISRSSFRPGEPGTTVVVGLIRGEHVAALRVTQDGRGLHGIRAGSFRWESGAPLGDPLERILGWQVSEPVILAVETPALCGGSVRLHWPNTEQRPHATHVQELSLRAQWQAREALREDAARFFSCPISRVDPLTEDIGPWVDHPDLHTREVTATVLFQREDPWTTKFPHPPPDVPACHLVILPVLLSELLGQPSGREALILVEEQRLSLIIRSGARLERVRCVPVGSETLVAHVHDALACSPSEATVLLERLNAGELTAESTQSLSRLLRSVVPLLRAALSVVSEGVPEDLTQVWMTGLWPLLFQRVLYGRRQAVGDAPLLAARVLPQPEFRHRAGYQQPLFPFSRLGLLEQLAAAIFTQHTQQAHAATPATVSGGRPLSHRA